MEYFSYFISIQTVSASSHRNLDALATQEFNDDKLIIDLKYVQCAFHVVKVALDNSPYPDIWNQYMPALANALGRFVDCIDNGDLDRYLLACISMKQSLIDFQGPW